MEVLLTVRPLHMRFMAGAAVFPGGALSEADLDPRWERASGLSGTEAAERLGMTDERAALGAFVCALREAFEEVGFLVGSGLAGVPRDEADDPSAWLESCLAAGAVLATERLVPGGRWVTPEGAPVRFDAAFFLVTAPPGWEPVPDEREVAGCMWLSPVAALDRLAEGRLAMAPPTVEMLQRLTGHRTAGEAEEALTNDRLTGAGKLLSMRLSPLVHGILAPNPGVMTGPGTNTYVVGSGPTIVIDPAVDDDDYLHTLLELAGDVTGILVTHRHGDHVGGIAELVRQTGAPVYAFGSEPAGGVPVTAIRDGDVIRAGGVSLVALHTPGHASDHLAFYFEGAASLFAGDNVLGEGTSVIAPPDGDMGDFMRSLERMSRLHVDRIYPGHFRPLDGGESVLRELLAHRVSRGEAILSSFSGSALSVPEVVADVYVDVPEQLHPVAELSVLAHLQMFERQGLVHCEDGRWRRTTDE